MLCAYVFFFPGRYFEGKREIENDKRDGENSKEKQKHSNIYTQGTMAHIWYELEHSHRQEVPIGDKETRR